MSSVSIYLLILFLTVKSKHYRLYQVNKKHLLFIIKNIALSEVCPVICVLNQPEESLE